MNEDQQQKIKTNAFPQLRILLLVIIASIIAVILKLFGIF